MALGGDRGITLRIERRRIVKYKTPFKCHQGVHHCPTAKKDSETVNDGGRLILMVITFVFNIIQTDGFINLYIRKSLPWYVSSNIVGSGLGSFSSI